MKEKKVSVGNVLVYDFLLSKRREMFLVLSEPVAVQGIYVILTQDGLHFTSIYPSSSEKGLKHLEYLQDT